MPRASKIFFDARDRSHRAVALHPSAIGVEYHHRGAEEVASILDGVAVLCIDGPLSHGPWSWGDTYEGIVDAYRCLIQDESVRSIVLKINSPGGDVAGLFEAVRIMTDLKTASGKSVSVYVDEDCYSAAYAIAMCADEIIVPPTGNVGSIGVITIMAEMTEADKMEGLRFEVISSGSKKADGNPHVPLTDGAIARTQAKVDKLATMFFDLVAGSRKMKPDAVQAMQAGTYSGEDAVAVGLADSVMSFDELLTHAHASYMNEGTTMSGLIAATKALSDARAKLKAASTDEERTVAKAAVQKAEIKYKHVKKTTETYESEDESDMPGAEDEDAESDDADDDDDGGDSDDDAPPSSKGSKALADTAEEDIGALVKKLTGKSTNAEIVGVLHSFAEQSKRSARLEKELAELKARDAKREVAELVQAGMRAGKIAPSQKKWALSQSSKTLQAYLAATPRLVKTLSDESAESPDPEASVTTVSPEMAKIWTRQGFAAKDFPRLLAEMNATKGLVK